MKTFFVAGTDTEVGKTFITQTLLMQAAQQGYSTLGIKPIASGAVNTPEGLRNEDALKLQQASSVKVTYENSNPFLFKAAVAPHIAAAQENRIILLEELVVYCTEMMRKQADLTLIEGVGGWRVPLNQQMDSRRYVSDLPKQLNVPVLLVVGLKLGCLNHAFLTQEAIVNDGLEIAGWVANQIDPEMACVEENLQTLQRELSAPCLGYMPHSFQADSIQTLTSNRVTNDVLGVSDFSFRDFSVLDLSALDLANLGS